MLSAVDMPAGPGGCSQAVCYAHHGAAQGIFHAPAGHCSWHPAGTSVYVMQESPGASTVSGT